MSYKKEKSIVLDVLKAHRGTAMSVVDIINYAHKQGMTESIDAPRDAHSHPFWRVCTSIKNENTPNVFVGKKICRSSKGNFRMMFAYCYLGY